MWVKDGAIQPLTVLQQCRVAMGQCGNAAMGAVHDASMSGAGRTHRALAYTSERLPP